MTDCFQQLPLIVLNPLKVIFMNVLFAWFILYTTYIKKKKIKKKKGHKGLTITVHTVLFLDLGTSAHFSALKAQYHCGDGCSVEETGRQNFLSLFLKV